MKKSLKQFIFQEMEKKGYVLDQEVSDFLGKEPNYCTIEGYKQQYTSFENAKDRFGEMKNVEIKKGGRNYLLRNDEMEDNAWYKIPKSYYEYLLKIKRVL